MSKKRLVGMIIIVGILLVVGFFLLVKEKEINEEDIECVKVRTTCCSCNMGGKEKCVLKSEVEKYSVNLSECSEDIVCLAVYGCEIESCGYVDGKCVAV